MHDILRSALKVGIATLASLMGWLVAGKILSLQLGAAGVGLFGLLRQLLQYLTTLATLNGQNALVQGIASRDEGLQARYAGSVLKIQVWSGLAVAGLLFLGAPFLGGLLLPHPSAVSLLRWLALGVVSMTAQTYFLGLLNGYRQVDALMRSQLVGPVMVMGLALPMVWLVRGGHAAGFVLMLSIPSAAVAVSAYIQIHGKGLLPVWRQLAIHRDDARQFFRVSTVLLAAGIAVTGAQYLQSWLVAHHLGLEQAGQFWVAWTLSMTYVTLLLGSYGTYYMPSLSKLGDDFSKNEMIHKYMKLTVVLMPTIIILVIVLKPLIIKIMFSEKLLYSTVVMRWMLIGDYFKGISWVLAFPMLAFNDLRWFFWTEFILCGSTALASWIILHLGGTIEGLGIVFMLIYIIYLIIMLYYAKMRYQFVLTKVEFLFIVLGFSQIVFISWIAWNSYVVEIYAGVAVVLLVLLNFVVMKKYLFKLSENR